MPNRSNGKLIVVSDLHVNSTRGLWPTSNFLDEGNSLTLNPFQTTLWRWWEDFTAQVRACKGATIVVNGDVIHGSKPNKDSQVMTHSAKDMRRAAKQVLAPLVENAGKVYFVRGTEWHEGTGGADLEDIAADFDNVVQDEQTTQYSYWALWLKWSGLLFHFTHHVSVGPDNPLTALRKEIDRAKREHVDHGQPMPDVMVRSHRHQYDVAVDADRFYCFVTPAWQLQTAFVVKRNPISLPDIGGLFFEVQEGRLQWQKVTYSLPKPKIMT